MRAELNFIAEAEGYLLGTMTTEEHSQFEEKMRLTPDLKKLVLMQESIVSGVQRMALRKSAVHAFRVFILRKIIFYTAIGFAIATLVYWGFSQINSEGSTGIQTKESAPIEFGSAPSEMPVDSDTLVQVPAENQWSVPVNTCDPGSHKAATDSSDSSPVTVDETAPHSFQVDQDGRLVNQPNIIDQAPQEWYITRRTSRSELKIIANEIARCGGELEIKNVKYLDRQLMRIDFVVSNQYGEVKYGSPYLTSDDVICIRFNGKQISAGYCGSNANGSNVQSEDLLKSDSTGVKKENNDNPGTVQSNDVQINQLDPLRKKVKRKRFFQADTRYESGFKRNSYKRKRGKFYR